jgi:hypothetical protein
MTATVLVPGFVFRAPERKTSKTGKHYVSATIRAGNGTMRPGGSACALANLAATSLMRLADGDAASVSGSFKVEIYEKDGEQRLSHTIFADRVLSAHPVKREKKEPAAASAKLTLEEAWPAASDRDLPWRPE